MQHEEENDLEVSADTPIGRLAAKGLRVSDIIALLTLLGVCGMVFVGLQITKLLADHDLHSADIQGRFVNSIREAAMAQRMNTCILSLPQDKREQEYMQPNGFCRQMAQINTP